jgi:hypothetical protein
LSFTLAISAHPFGWGQPFIAEEWSASCRDTGDLAVTAFGLLDDSVAFLARHLYYDGVLLYNAVWIAL